jgi:hypothetical protein
MPNFMDRMSAGLLGPTTNYGGILNPQDEQAAQQQARMAMFSNLLANSGYTDRPTTLGQAVGGAMQAGRQTQNESLQQALQAQLMKSRAAQQSSPYGAIQPDKFTPESLAKFEQTGKYSDLVLRSIGMQFGRYNPGDFTPESWAAFLETDDPSHLVRYVAPQAATVERTARGIEVIQPSRVGGPARRESLTTQEQENAATGAAAEAAAGGKVAGETATTAKFDLPRIEDNANQTITLLDRLRDHPGRKMATGASSVIPADKLPATEARNFVALLGQLRGKQFLEAFNMLKGGGQITEVEGAKAESAIATIQDRGQSEAAYLQAIEDLRKVVQDGVSRARQKAGGNTSTSATGAKKRYNPATGKIE